MEEIAKQNQSILRVMLGPLGACPRRASVGTMKIHKVPACSHVACDLLCLLHEKVTARDVDCMCLFVALVSQPECVCLCVCATRLYPEYPCRVLRLHWNMYLHKLLENRRCVAVCY